MTSWRAETPKPSPGANRSARLLLAPRKAKPQQHFTTKRQNTKPHSTATFASLRQSLDCAMLALVSTTLERTFDESTSFRHRICKGHPRPSADGPSERYTSARALRRFPQGPSSLPEFSALNKGIPVISPRLSKASKHTKALGRSPSRPSPPSPGLVRCSATASSRRSEGEVDLQGAF